MELNYQKINGETRLMPMVGYPIKGGGVTSAFNKLLEVRGVNHVMLPLELEKGRLPEFLKARELFHIERFSLTMPHKADIIPFLDEVDESSRLFGSVNQVKTVDGKLVGKGFDGIGTVAAVKAAGAKLEDTKVMLIGAGSIAGVIGYEFSRHGAAHLTILNRTVEKAQGIAEALNAHTKMKSSWGGLSEKELDEAAAQADVLVQASAQGMSSMPEHKYLGFLKKLPSHCVVMEGVVSPVETTFVEEARGAGFEPVLGLDMAVQQAAEVMKFMFDDTIEEKDKRLLAQIICDMYQLPVPKQWQD